MSLQDFSYIAVIAAAAVSLVALIVNIIKSIREKTPSPHRRALRYEDDFGDYISNCGIGPMKIVGIKFYYNNKECKAVNLVDIYSTALVERGYVVQNWITFISSKEIIGRWMAPGETIKLVETNPKDNDNNPPGLLAVLRDIRSKITIVLEYQSVFGIRTLTAKLEKDF